MNWLYSFALLIALTFIIPVYFFRLRLIRKERMHLTQRLGMGIQTRRDQRPALWIHAVSVGEVLSLQNLIKELKKRNPKWIIYFSSLTSSGLRMAREKLKDVDQTFFVPFDFSVVARRFFRLLKPDILVLVESEFWPNLIRTAEKKCRGVMLLNGRISRSSFRRYRRFRILVSPILRRMRKILVQTPLDAERLIQIGIPSETIEIAGNLKTEVTLSTPSESDIRKMKMLLGIPENLPVLIAGSTHRGEEEMLLKAYSTSRNKDMKSRFILAPRHPDRAEEIENLCDQWGLKPVRRTTVKNKGIWDVLILDTIGDLARMYSIADAAFIGGSLIRRGGQNFLEPAFYGKPIFFGPHMDNFSDLAEIFLEAEAACQVRNENDLLRFFCLEDFEALKNMGIQAKKTLLSLQGATDKSIRAIESLMEE